MAWWGLALLWWGSGSLPASAGTAPTRVTVEVEETVYRFEPANNGAGPMWCAGSTCVVRVGDVVYASGLETVPGWKPLNNCRWVLWRRDAQGWARWYEDEQGRTREPSPLVRVGSDLLLSANPTTLPPEREGGGPARPEILRWIEGGGAAPERVAPRWQGEPRFTEHSYRSFAADPRSGTTLLLQNIDYGHAEWSFTDPRRGATGAGQLRWPWGDTYAKPQPVRLCYPTVALRGREAHFFGVSDITEPNPAFREFKRQLTGREWDYDFRRLFYAVTPDITRQPFSPWIEIASREETCGWLWPCDLALVRRGETWVLWTERALDERLRERFFPEARQWHGLVLARIRNGKVISRTALRQRAEGAEGPLVNAARFHQGPDRRWHVLLCSSEGGKTRNELVELDREGKEVRTMPVPFATPFTSFFTATPRAGNQASEYVDVLGLPQGEGQVMRYARLRLR